MNIEILTKNESVKHKGQRISFDQQETTEIKSRIRAAWATFHKYRQELTSKNYMLKHDATISPTVCYAAGTWASNKEHERMIQSMQRKMLRLIIQTKRKYKKIEKQDIEPKDENRKVDITDMCSADESTKTHDDVDSGVTFEDDVDEEMDAIEEEDWIEYTKRSTVDAMDKMERAKIRCWNRTHKNEMEIGTENCNITE